jgi:hypothetical protein
MTYKPNVPPRSLVTRIRDVFVRPFRTPITEMVGRVQHAIVEWSWRQSGSVDRTKVDYAFWDKLRRGFAEGYELGALYCKPILDHLTNFVFTGGISVKIEREETADPSEPENETLTRSRAYTERKLSAFFRRYAAVLLGVHRDKLALGDQYVIVNADGSLAVASPDSVRVEYGDNDYRNPTRITIKTTFTRDDVDERGSPKKTDVIVEDAYTDDTRTITLTEGTKKLTPQEYANPIGRIPIVHFAHARSANEAYGHPVYEALLRLFSRTDDLLEKTLDGVELLGNPILTFEDVLDAQKAIDTLKASQDETYTDSAGNQETRTVLRIDRLPALFLEHGKAKFVAPERGFTGDANAMLEKMFSLICAHTSIPEFIYGSAVPQSKASTNSQMPPFEKVIESLRIDFEGMGTGEDGETATGGLYHLIDLWLRAKRLTDPNIMVAPTTIRWHSTSIADENIHMQKVIYLDGKGYIPGGEVVDLLNVVKDPETSYARAQTERQQAPDEFLTALERETQAQTDLNTVAHRDMNPENGVNAPAEPNLREVTPPMPGGGKQAA